jgi:hypothetical protein
MKKVIVENDVIVNIIEADDNVEVQADWIKALPTATGNEGIGWIWNGTEFEAPPPPPEPFKPLSRPAFFFMAEKIGITESNILALVAAMPETTPEEEDAKMLARNVVKYNQEFLRDNSLLNALAGAQGLTEAEVDAAWRVAEGVTW